jgi:hypothetical protein
MSATVRLKPPMRRKANCGNPDVSTGQSTDAYPPPEYAKKMQIVTRDITMPATVRIEPPMRRKANCGNQSADAYPPPEYAKKMQIVTRDVTMPATVRIDPPMRRLSDSLLRQIAMYICGSST